MPAVSNTGTTLDAATGSRSERGRARRWWLLALLAAASLLGCRTATGRQYTYENLPTHLVAQRRENAKTVDLSRLASAASDSELIDRGDVVEISIATGLSEKDVVTFKARVGDDGVAKLQTIGDVPLAGLEMEAAEAAISAACIQRQLYRNPQVTVTMKQQRVNRVTVVGAVKQPGVYRIPRGQSDLLAALVAAGGLSDDAGTKVDIRNPVLGGAPNLSPGPIAGGAPDGVNAVGHSLPAPVRTASAPRLESIQVDLVSATKSGSGGYLVNDGGIVTVERRDPEPVHVLGLVHKPNRYEFPIAEDLRVLDALALAGGVSSPVANKVFVIRREPNSHQTSIVTLSISAAKRDERANLRLSPGDIVSVEQTPMTVFIDTLRIINFGFGASLPLTTLL